MTDDWKTAWDNWCRARPAGSAPYVELPNLTPHCAALVRGGKAQCSRRAVNGTAYCTQHRHYKGAK